MSSYGPSITPRLRVARTPSFSYDRNVSQIATATDDGQPHFLGHSQLIDMDLDSMPTSGRSGQHMSTNSATNTPNHSENKAVQLRSLISRLSNGTMKPPPPKESQDYLSERESDYDMDLTEPANIAPSVIQENVKDIFSKARRDPGDTPQKKRFHPAGDDASEIPSNTESNRSSGKRHNLSDDDVESSHALSHRPTTRFKRTPPITAEFLAERFSKSHVLPDSADEDHNPSLHIRSADIASFQTNLPVATSTPQQSLMMSFNSQFQSNLLDQDTEMQHNFNDLISDGDASANRSLSPPPTLRKRALLQSELSIPVYRDRSEEDDSKTPTATRSSLYSGSYQSSMKKRDMNPPNSFKPIDEEVDGTTPRRDITGMNHDRYTSMPSSSSMTRMLTDGSEHTPPPSPPRSNSSRHRSRDDFGSKYPAKIPNSDVINEGREVEQMWDHRSGQSTHAIDDTHSKEIRQFRRDTSNRFLEEEKVSSSAKSSQKAGISDHIRPSSPQVIDSTYHHADADARNSTPSSPPLPSPKNFTKAPSSPKTDRVDSSPIPIQNSLVRDQNPWDSLQLRGPIGTYREDSMYSDADDSNPGSQRTPQPSISTPSSGKEPTPETACESSTPPPSSSQTRPKSGRKSNIQPPSPVNDPPELPTPSSDDESDNNTGDASGTPNNGRGEPSYLPTPKPPGGWLQTPAPLRSNTTKWSLPAMKGADNTFDEDPEPKTPAKFIPAHGKRYEAKTPKPPGGWQTPAPSAISSSRLQTSQERRQDKQDLLTPISALSRSSFYDPKTPHPPGGWATTPATRKSSLKVRFNQGPSTTSSDTHSTSYAHRIKNPLPSDSADEDLHRKSHRSEEQNFRLPDAFGREKGDVDSTQSRNEADDCEIKEDYEDGIMPSRKALLSRIRRGFDDLVGDIAESEGGIETQQVIDQTRIHELHALSTEARKARERLLERATNVQVKFESLSRHKNVASSFDLKLSHLWSKPFYVSLLLLQILFLLMMYRFSVVRAKSLFLNSYYDPFNPELYLYIFKHDTSFRLVNADFSRTSQQSIGQALLEEGQRVWYCGLHFMKDMIHFTGTIYSYFWSIWSGNMVTQTTTILSPT